MTFIHLDPINCVANLCDLTWLILDNPQLLNMNVMGGTCSNGTSFNMLNPMGFTSCNITTTSTSVPPTTTQSLISGCPPSTSISPCTCTTAYMMNGITSLYVNCYNTFQNITDSQLSNALDVFLSPQYISPVVQIMAMQNQLTHVPSQISKFKSLTFLDLSYNQITNISPLSGLSFPFNASYVSIMLMNNKITNIPSGTINITSVTSITVDLSSNNITSLPTKAFTFPSTNSMMMNMLNLRNNQITIISPGAFQGILSFHFSRYFHELLNIGNRFFLKNEKFALFF